jgi:hypothetical protein
VLLAGEPLLLSRGDDVTIAQQGRGGIVVEGRNAEDVGRHESSAVGFGAAAFRSNAAEYGALAALGFT